MKSYEETTAEILQKLQRTKRKRSVKRALVAFSVVAAILVIILPSNIIYFDFSVFNNAYKKFMKSYVSDGESFSGLKLLDRYNAVLAIDEEAFPCTYEHVGGNDFILTTAAKSDETARQFSVGFTDKTARIKEDTAGGEFSATLNIHEDLNVESGVWSLFAMSVGGGELDYEPSENAWIAVLDNGECYSSDNVADVNKSEFLACGDRVFHNMYNSFGSLTFSSLFEYEESGVFDFPVIKNIEPNEGEIPSVYYMKLLEESELIDYGGGEFAAKGVMYSRDNEQFDATKMGGYQRIKWQLFEDSTIPETLLSAMAGLDLNSDSSCSFKVWGDSEYNTSSEGKWYRLKDCILVVLDKSNKLTGKFFTVYAGYFEAGYMDADESFESSAITRTSGNSYYKVGYNKFQYINSTIESAIYWGESWDREYLMPKLHYDSPYVLSLEYCPLYYDSEDYIEHSQIEEDLKIADIDMHLIFREDGQMEVYRNGIILYQQNYYVESKYVQFSKISLYKGAANIVEISGLNVSGANLFLSSTMHYSFEGLNMEFELYHAKFALKKSQL